LSNTIVLVAFLATTPGLAQDLTPRAYVITPVSSNALILSYSWNKGEVLFDPSVPIEDAKGRFQTSVLSYYHSFSLLDRSANVVVSVPYATGNFSGVVNGISAQSHLSGTADARLRISVNLRGGPAMRLRQFVGWREKTLIGTSVTAVMPSGQYDRARALNIGTNRWAVKPEIGVTRRLNRWVVEAYTGVWLYTSNSSYFPGNAKRTQRPVIAMEAHAGYYLRPRLWASLDGNFWAGGRSSHDGREKQDAQRESRMGVTFSVPFRRQQSFKFSYSRGAYKRIGGNFQTVSAAWQFSWIGKPE
jgi:hypothetical protein